MRGRLLAFRSLIFQSRSLGSRIVSIVMARASPRFDVTPESRKTNQFEDRHLLAIHEAGHVLAIYESSYFGLCDQERAHQAFDIGAKFGRMQK